MKLTEEELSKYDKKTITFAGEDIDLYIKIVEDSTTLYAINGYKTLMSWHESSDKQIVAEFIVQELRKKEESDVV